MDDSRAQEKILDITLDVRVSSRKVGTEDSKGGVTIMKNMKKKSQRKHPRLEIVARRERRSFKGI